MSIDQYDSSRPYYGASFDFSKSGGSGAKWRTEEDRQRVKEYEENWNIFLGKHWIGNGGPWPHPYGLKGRDEGIPYQQLNIMGKASKAFANLILGGGIIVQSEDENAMTVLENVDLRKIKQALIMSSVFGFCGLQPSPVGDVNDNKWSINVIKPCYLYPEFSLSDPDKVIKIRKCIPYLKTALPNGGYIDLLFEETHYSDRIETRLYEISGENIVKEIDLQFYRLIDEEANVFPLWQHNFGEFFVSLLFNERIGEEILSDYTISAKHTQQALNERLTQIDRVLKLHSNPKLMAPKSAFTQDPDTGRYYWMNQDSEVLIGDPNDPNAYSYLTWNGELVSSIERRDNLILSLCTEMDVAPQLLAFTHLVSGTTAETAEKLKQMMHPTVKRAEGKREESWYAIDSTVRIILNISGIDADFSVKFPEIFLRTRTEVLEEVGFRKDRDLITTKDSFILLDNLTEEEAEQKALEVFEEKENKLPNPYNTDNVPDRFFAPVINEEEEENAAVQ